MLRNTEVYMKKVKLSIILIAFVYLMTGCKDTKKEEQITKEKTSEEKIVENQIKEFLEGYKQKDEKISELLLGTSEADSMSFEGISAYFADGLEYEIKSCKKKEDDLYNVEIEIKTIDFEQLFSNSYQETVDKYGEEGITDKFMSEMEQNIKEKDYEVNKSVCNVNLMKLNDEFKIQMDSSLANALTGGMNDYLASLQQGGE